MFFSIPNLTWPNIEKPYPLSFGTLYLLPAESHNPTHHGNHFATCNKLQLQYTNLSTKCLSLCLCGTSRGSGLIASSLSETGPLRWFWSFFNKSQLWLCKQLAQPIYMDDMQKKCQDRPLSLQQTGHDSCYSRLISQWGWYIVFISLLFLLHLRTLWDSHLLQLLQLPVTPIMATILTIRDIPTSKHPNCGLSS